MLKASNLTCVRGERLLFAELGFLLEAGQVLHVRGTNGAGKTSLLRILCGLSLPEAGQVVWRGSAIAEQSEVYHQDLLYLGHQSALQEALTVHENLLFCATLCGVLPTLHEVGRVLASVGLQGFQNKLVRHLSQGQKRRVALLRLMLSRAALWVLDEPFVALDHAAVQWLSGLLLAHLTQGGLVVLTSHQPVAIGTISPQILLLGA